MRRATQRPTRLRRVLVLAVSAALIAPPAYAATGTTPKYGFEGPRYDTFDVERRGGPATGQKPESKLWYHAGSWWTVMASAAHDGVRTVHRLVVTRWHDTGTVVDDRADTKEDVLVAGDRVYILSRASRWSGANRLGRYSFSEGRYALDEGFPVTVPGGGAEAATISRDTTGTLWLAYEKDGVVSYSHTVGGDHDWSPPTTFPHEGARTVDSDDIAAVVAFTDEQGPSIGVMWSNQPEGRQYFAVHRDGTPTTEWSFEVALEGGTEADDHISLQSAEGRVYAAVKTSNTAPGEPAIRLLVREPDGPWSSHIVSLVKERHTRPHLQIHIDQRRLYVFGTVKDGDATYIGVKSAGLDERFFPGRATPVLTGDADIDDATGAKQVATSESGILVLAGDGTRYQFAGLPDPVTASACNRHRSRLLTFPQVVRLGRWDAAGCMAWWAVAAPLLGHPLRYDADGMASTLMAGLTYLQELSGVAGDES